jgi:hypothetical protein
VLTRLNAVTLQMFPEMDGYTGKYVDYFFLIVSLDAVCMLYEGIILCYINFVILFIYYLI